VEQHRDMIPRRVRGAARCGFVSDPGACKCQNIKSPYRGSRCGGSEPVRASSEADLTRGGVQPSSEADLTRGGVQPSGEADLTRGGVQPSSEADLPRGGVQPSSEADLT
jgi:hypothetical protein